MPVIDIIIVNYYSVTKIQHLLATLFASTLPASAYRVFIVSNSPEKELDLIRGDNRITLLEQPRNIGFGKACNAALAYGNSTFVLLLNPDTALFPTTLQDCIDFMAQRPDITVLGLQHINEKGQIAPSCSRFFTLGNHINHILGLSKLSPRLFKHSTVMKDYDYTMSGEVDQVMGAFMMVRRSFINRYGFMDERYFVFGEDMDFCRKVWENGGKVYYNAGISIIHESHGSTENITGKRICFAQEGRLKYAYKYFNSIQYILLLLMTLILEPITRLVYAALKGNLGQMKETINAYLLLWQRRQFR